MFTNRRNDKRNQPELQNAMTTHSMEYLLDRYSHMTDDELERVIAKMQVHVAKVERLLFARIEEEMQRILYDDLVDSRERVSGMATVLNVRRVNNVFA